MTATETATPPRRKLLPAWSVPRFIPVGMSIEDFFRDLNASGCRYAVLRWFEQLPIVQPGEDIDILVHDDDVHLLRDRLRGKPRLRKLIGARHVRCDVYSVSGVRGASYRGLAYYPPHLAMRILEGAIMHQSGARVPNPRDHFLSLTFHALYHKGLRSGIPVRSPDLQPASAPEHDYADVLRGLARQTGVEVEIEMDALEQELARHGWRPPVDFIERLLPEDAWAKRRHPARSGRFAQPGLAVFLLRERALTRPAAVDSICDLLREDGFTLLAIKKLTSGEREALGRELRGANWGAGPWALSGGLPALVIAAMDVFPKPPDRSLLRRHPAADNQQVFVSKQRIRDWHNETLPPEQRCNIVHSSDNCAQALTYLETAMPELMESTLEAASRLRERCELSGEVVECLSRSRKRALIELIRRDSGALVVRKRYRPGMEEYFGREINALKELGCVCPDTVPEVLERGDNYFIMPYYESGLSRLSRNLGLPLPVPAVKKAFLAAKAFFEHGYVLSDFRPHNLIVERGNRIRIIDYEDCYSRNGMEDAPRRFEDLECFDPKEFDLHWARAAALAPGDLIRDPVWLLYLKRYGMGWFIFTRSVIRKAGRNVLRSIKRRRQRLGDRRQRRGRALRRTPRTA